MTVIEWSQINQSWEAETEVPFQGEFKLVDQLVLLTM